MDTTNTQQPINDDQELAKVLAGINEEAQGMSVPAPGETAPSTQPPAATSSISDDVTSLDALEETPLPGQIDIAPLSEAPEPEKATLSTDRDDVTPAPTGELADIKDQVLDELRPLVDKLNVSPDEKFDTLLLLLRSTDDKTLIKPAHEAAKQITDESRRAQALLDIVKEIDYLSAPHNS